MPRRKNKNKKRPEIGALFIEHLSALNLTGTQATGANINGLVRSVNHSLHLADVGLPGSVALTVGVRNGVTEHNALTTYTALCHGKLPPNRLHAAACAALLYKSTDSIIAYNFQKSNRLCEFF